MKKIIFIILLVLINIISYVNAEVYYALNNDEFGNINYGYTTDAGITIGGADNYTACIPFVAGYSGWLDSITFDWKSYNDYAEWWISPETDMHMENAPISGYVGSNATISFPNYYTGLNNIKMIKGDFYYLCLRGTDTVDFNTVKGVTTEYISDGYPSLYGLDLYNHYSLTSANSDSFNPLVIYDYYTGTIWEHTRQFKLDGILPNSYEEITDTASTYERPQMIEFCWKYGFLGVDDDNCYFLGKESSQRYVTLDSTDSDHWVGEKFKYTLEDGVMDSFTIYMYGGTGVNNAEELSVRFWKLDANYNYSTLLFNKTGISSANVRDRNISNLTVNTHNILIENNNNYLIEFSCSLGCNGGTDVYVFAHNGLVPTSKYKQGFQDTEAYGFENDTNVQLTTTYDGLFKLHFTDNVFSESEEISLSTEFCSKTNVQNCLFYDNFDYSDNYDLTTLNYSLTPEESFIVYNETLVHNYNKTVGIIEHDFITKLYNYDMLRTVYTFNTRYISTPTDMEIEGDSKFNTYIIENYCDDSLTHQYRIVFYRWFNSSSSNTLTFFNLYDTNGDNFDLAGTYLIRNGNKVVLNNDVDFQTRKGYLYISSDTIASSVFEGFASGDYVKYIYDLDFSCEPDNFFLYKTGLHNDSDKFITIDSILYYGYDYDTSSDVDDTISDDDFYYTNQTTQEDAVVKSEIGELLHNMAFTLGFKSATSKMFFWIILMILLLMLFSQVDLSSTAKTYIGSFLILMLFITGKYYLFIPTVIFVFLIFIVAVIGGMVFFKLFSGRAGE